MGDLRGYQENQISQLSGCFQRGLTSVLSQLDTGGGKTVEFAAISDRFIRKQNKRVCINVHRKELASQTRDTLKEWYNIDCQLINDTTKNIYDYPVYIAMCETLHRRMKVNSRYLPPIGLSIIDEAHLGNFKKIHQHFEDSISIGFTATPISTTKKDPLRNYYQDIVVGPGIPYLIGIAALLQNHTYGIEGLNRSRLILNQDGEFDKTVMGNEFSRSKHVQNAIKAYKEFSEGHKAIVFNSNIAHSQIMTRAFNEAGYPAMHVDGTTPNDQRDYIFKWFKKTPGAILNNYGIATMGFDEPTIETVIVNRATTSLTLWLQMCGRGARPFPIDYYCYGRKWFNILDLGGNAQEHMDWNYDQRDWNDMFWNPGKPKDKVDAAPLKDCPQCRALVAIQSKACPYCGWQFPVVEPTYDTSEVKLVLVTKNLNVEDIIKKNEELHHKQYTSLYEIINNVGTQVKYKLGKRPMSTELAEQMLAFCEVKAEEWCKLMNKQWDNYHKRLVKDTLYKQFKTNHAYMEPLGQIKPLQSLVMKSDSSKKAPMY